MKLAARSASATAILISMSLPISCWAFDENGFSSGMTLEAISRIVVARRGQLQLEESQSSGRNQFYVVTENHDGLVSVTGEGFSLCSGHLNFYSTHVNGGFPAFARLVEKGNDRFGAGNVITGNGETGHGTFYAIEVEWSFAQGKNSAGLSQLSNQSVDVSRSFRSNSLECG